MTAMAAFPGSLPTGALRPPVAVGPIDDDDYAAGYGVGHESPTNRSFRSGGWSFPAVQSDPAVAGGYGGWGLPPSSSHGGAGGWDVEPDYAADSRGFSGAGGSRSSGWGGIDVSSGPAAERGSANSSWGAPESQHGGGGWGGCGGCGGCGGTSGQERFAQDDVDLPPMLDKMSGHFGNSINSKASGHFDSMSTRAAARVEEPGQALRGNAGSGCSSSSRGCGAAYSHARHLESLHRSTSQVETPPQPGPPPMRYTQASMPAEPIVSAAAVRHVAVPPSQPDRVLPASMVTSTPTDHGVLLPQRPYTQPQPDHGVLLPQRPYTQPQPALMCPHCGNVYATDSNFCRKCGQKRSVTVIAQPPLALAEHWVASYPSYPVVRTPAITYPNGCHINFQELAPTVAPVAVANVSHRPRMIPHIESGDLVRQTLLTYRACDRNLSGNLQWSNGEIQDFIAAVFQQQGLAPPNESDMYQLFVRFDEDRNSVLDARECVCMVDALFRAVFYAEEPRFAQHSALPPPRILDPRAGSSSIVSRQPSYNPVALPSSLSVPSTRDAASAYAFPSREPSYALTTDHGHILEPAHSFPSQFAPSRLIPARPATTSHLPPSIASHHAAASVHPLSQHPAASLHPLADHPLSHPTTMPARLPQRSTFAPHSMPPPHSLPPQHSMPPPEPEEEEEEDHVKIQHRIEDMGDGQTRKPPRSTEKPPAWHEIEEREHLISVELDEVEVHPDAPDLQPGFFEAIKYFVSLHPRSEEPDHIPLPRDAPMQSVDGHYLVSTSQRAQIPGVQVGGFFSNRATEDSDSEEEAKPRKAKSVQYPVAIFKEKLELIMDKLDHYLVAYVWATKSSIVSAQSTTLVGRALAPLQDFKLQRRSTTWGIFDIIEGHRVADMRLKYHVCTTPGPVQNPTATDIKQTEVTAKWSPPSNDHGAPVLGYKVSILLDPKQNEGPQWYTLCDCTKSLNPAYVAANLTGNTAYLLDVRAVNKVGAGDPCEFQITTAPVEPDPPSKPWVEESRDGCLNVAWHPPESDGGMQVTAFRIRMRKILGASKWNPFGPGESSATWVEMGSVGAAMSEQAESTMYNAWVGPLEPKACEYRFQVFAQSKVGEGRGSEMSEPHYT